MPLVDITNPVVTKFLIENYEKENRLRLNWIVKNEQAINDAATLQRKATDYYEKDVSAHCMKAGMVALTRDHITSGYNKKCVPIHDGKFIPTTKDLQQGHSIIALGLGEPQADPRLARPDSDLSPDPIMRPVNPEINEIIYKPKPEFGRMAYLKKRMTIKPEYRYYFAECDSMGYGWRLCDDGPIRGPAYPKIYTLIRAMRTRVGPQPDPAYYQSPEISSTTKCSTL